MPFAEDPARESLLASVGPLALLFIIVLGVALFFLIRSMNRQLKRIDPELPAGPDDRRRQEDAELQQQAVERGADEQPPQR